jgi:hypothetical protein
MAANNSLGVKMLAGFMGAVAAISPLGLSNDASAQEARVASVPSRITGAPTITQEQLAAAKIRNQCPAAIRVPCYNFGDTSKAAAETAGAVASADAIAVTLFGNDPVKLEAIQRAIEKLNNNPDFPLGVGLVLGPNYGNEVHINVNGQRAFPRQGVRGTVIGQADYIEGLIVTGYDRYQSSLTAQQSSNPVTSSLAGLPARTPE